MPYCLPDRRVALGDTAVCPRIKRAIVLDLAANRSIGSCLRKTSPDGMTLPDTFVVDRREGQAPYAASKRSSSACLTTGGMVEPSPLGVKENADFVLSIHDGSRRHKLLWSRRERSQVGKNEGFHEVHRKDYQTHFVRNPRHSSGNRTGIFGRLQMRDQPASLHAHSSHSAYPARSSATMLTSFPLR